MNPVTVIAKMNPVTGILHYRKLIAEGKSLSELPTAHLYGALIAFGNGLVPEPFRNPNVHYYTIPPSTNLALKDIEAYFQLFEEFVSRDEPEINLEHRRAVRDVFDAVCCLHRWRTLEVAQVPTPSTSKKPTFDFNKVTIGEIEKYFTSLSKKEQKAAREILNSIFDKIEKEESSLAMSKAHPDALQESWDTSQLDKRLRNTSPEILNSIFDKIEKEESSLAMSKAHPDALQESWDTSQLDKRKHEDVSERMNTSVTAEDAPAPAPPVQPVERMADPIPPTKTPRIGSPQKDAYGHNIYVGDVVHYPALTPDNNPAACKVQAILQTSWPSYKLGAEGERIDNPVEYSCLLSTSFGGDSAYHTLVSPKECSLICGKFPDKEVDEVGEFPIVGDEENSGADFID